MAFITGKTMQGNCGAVIYTGNGHYTCGPVPDLPGVDPRTVDQIIFYARIEGKVGETVHLDIRWPAFDPELCGKRKYIQDPFFTVAHRCIYISTDELNWERIENVSVDAQNWTMSVSLTLKNPVTFVSVNYYYTCRMYAALRETLAQTPWVEEAVLGQCRDGQELRLYKATDPNVPLSDKKIVYLQAGQHCCEYGGMHLLDAMLRYLSSGDAAANELLRKYEFHIVPVVSIADWSAGYKDEFMGHLDTGCKDGITVDSNMVWDTLSTPETRSIDAYLRRLPQRPVILLDLHNSRSNHLIAADYVSREMVDGLARFADLVTKNCDYMTPPGRVKWTTQERYANFKQYALQNFGYSLTMEISRFTLYSHELQKNVPLSAEGFARFARQLAHTIDAFISSEAV